MTRRFDICPGPPGPQSGGDAGGGGGGGSSTSPNSPSGYMNPAPSAPAGKSIALNMNTQPAPAGKASTYMQRDLLFRPNGGAGTAPDQISTAPNNWITARDSTYVLSGGNPATDGATVDTWNGKYNSYAYTQGTTSLKPLYKTDLFGIGVPSVLADGVDDYLTGSSGILSLTKNISSLVTIFFGSWIAFGGADTQLLWHANGVNASSRAIYTANASNGRRKIAARGLDADSASTITASASVPGLGLEVAVNIIDFTNKQGRILVNGTEYLAYTSLASMTAGNTSNTDSTNVQIFAFNATAPANYAMIDMVQWVNYIPTDVEIYAMTDYFKAIGGIA